MGEGDHRLDVVLQQLVEHVVVELQPLLIRLGLVALREDAGPGDRGTEAFEAHLGEQFDVFFIAAVEIHRFVVGVIFAGFHLVGDFTRHAVRPAGQYVADARAFAALIPAAFNLMRGNRAAP